MGAPHGTSLHLRRPSYKFQIPTYWPNFLRDQCTRVGAIASSAPDGRMFSRRGVVFRPASGANMHLVCKYGGQLVKICEFTNFNVLGSVWPMVCAFWRHLAFWPMCVCFYLHISQMRTLGHGEKNDVRTPVVILGLCLVELSLPPCRPPRSWPHWA